MDVNRDHVISIELSAEEWREFVELMPQPVNWLREKIYETIARARETQASSDGEPAAIA
jgi:hypothetical protein